jgi:copper(I)-binding protein
MKMVANASRLMALSALLFAAASVYGQTGGSGMRVEGAWARRAPMMESSGPKGGSGNGAIYATLVNPGKERDALISATSDAAGAVEIHESYQDMGMMMMMRPVKTIEVPAGGKVEMKPGGYHIMLLNLKRELKAGQTVNVILRFQKAGNIPVSAEIK